MKLKLGNENIFECPEGNHRATLERIGEPNKRINRPCEEQVRLTFRIVLLDGKEHLVLRTFCADLSYGSELYNFLNNWLDGKWDAYQDDSGEVDLALLINKQADLIIKHVWIDKHPKPFVSIARIFPVGGLLDK